MRQTRSTDKIPGNIRRAVIVVLLIVSLGGVAAMAYKTAGTLYGYAFAEIEHREIIEEAVEEPEEEATEEATEEEEIPVLSFGGDKMPVTLPHINHAKLKEMNPDYFGWLYVPYSNINYPVCLRGDDSWYLDHTFKGKQNSAGCLFLNSKTNMSDPVWFIYGHNMKNGAMFGELDEISGSGVNRMYLLCPDKTYEFRFYSAHYTKADADTYSIPLTAEAKRAYYGKELKLSEKAFPYSPSVTDKTIVLSTCHGTTGGDGRYVVLAATAT